MNDKRPVSHILTGLAGGSFAFLAASTPVFGTTAGTSAAVTFLVMGGLGSIAFVALLRPTQSAGLYVQMVGRGTRLAPGKENCLVLDFAGNVRQSEITTGMAIG